MSNNIIKPEFKFDWAEQEEGKREMRTATAFIINIYPSNNHTIKIWQEGSGKSNHFPESQDQMKQQIAGSYSGSRWIHGSHKPNPKMSFPVCVQLSWLQTRLMQWHPHSSFFFQLFRLPPLMSCSRLMSEKISSLCLPIITLTFLQAVHYNLS